MHWTEIAVIILTVAFIAFMIVRSIYRHKKGLTGCDCGEGKGKALVKAYHKQKAKEGECCCCCQKDKTEK